MDIEIIKTAYRNKDWSLVAQFYQEVTGSQISNVPESFKISYDWRDTHIEEHPNKGAINENH